MNIHFCLFGRAALPHLAIAMMAVSAMAQEPPAAPQPKPQASVGASIGESGAGRIVVEARGELPKPAVFYATKIDNQATVSADQLTYEAKFDVEILQGGAKTLSYWLKGWDEITAVEGPSVKAWSVRQDDEKRRYLDVEIKTPALAHEFTVRMKTRKLKLPASLQVMNFAPAGKESASLHQVVALNYQSGVTGRVSEIVGFLPVEKATGQPDRFQSDIGGKFILNLNRAGAASEAVELSGFSLNGQIDDKQGTGVFQVQGTAIVRAAGASIAILKGRAALSRVPASANYRMELAEEGGAPVFRLVFPEPGEFPVSIDFVASVVDSGEAWRQMDFTVAASAVVPMTLRGLKPEIEFSGEPAAVVPIRQGADWLGFLPATGRANFTWKAARQTGEGRLFFTTTAKIEAQIGAGLLRQDHQIDYRILQGQLDALSIDLAGDDGEVLEVQGANITAWKVIEKEGGRVLEVTLSQPITDVAQLRIRTQTALDAFPVRLKGMRLTPEGAIRHSGYLRLSNMGSVRLEPAGLTGLTQLAPEQFPGEALSARQVFVYRFPSAAYDFEIAADRVQPEVGVSELVRYQITETDRIISADIELDIREAPIREWAIGIPEDYSVVAVTGSGVADYIVGSDAENGQRSLNVIFSEEIGGRQLVSVTMEKNEVAAAGDWVLPRLGFPDAKSIRGDIGVVGAPGFRIAVGATDLLVEKPLSYFPNPVPHLQQAFRIREPAWTATMRIEPLEKSVQADVFHLYSLSEGTAYASVVVNYFVTGAPVSEWELTVPEVMGNVMVDGQDVRTWRQDGDTLKVSLHQPVIGAYTLLVTAEEKLGSTGGQLVAGKVTPLGVQGERGYVQVVSPMQVKVTPATRSDGLLELDSLELPAEFRLLSAAPSLGTWQYTERPFELAVDVGWFEPGSTFSQVVEFSEVSSQVSSDGDLVTEILYYVKTRGLPALSVELPDSVRLWAVSVAGNAVNARQSEKATLIPLPGAVDPNTPVEVRLRLGRPAVDGKSPLLALPKVAAPVLKTEWRITGDESQVLVPVGGNVDPPEPVLAPSGFTRLARHGLAALSAIVLMTLTGGWLANSIVRRHQTIGLVAVILAVGVAIWAAIFSANQTDAVAPLQLSLPVLTPGEGIELEVHTMASWQVGLSWWGVVIGLAGIAAIVAPLLRFDLQKPRLIQVAGLVMVTVGLLLQRGSDPWFFAGVAAILTLLLLLPRGRDWVKNAPCPSTETASAAAMLAICVLTPGIANAADFVPSGFSAAQEIRQTWEIRHDEKRLFATGTIQITGTSGDSFILLKAPAVLTRFEGAGLKVSKQELPGKEGTAYVVSIPVDPAVPPADYRATFEYQLPIGELSAGIGLPTGLAAVQEVEASYDQPGWEFGSASAVRVEPGRDANQSAAKLLLGPMAKAVIMLKPKARDITSEVTQFFVEASNLYLPGPGVLDGRHRIQVRPSQGVVDKISIRVPVGLTVSEVTGPVGSWQFDAETGALALNIEPAQSKAFVLQVDTQRGLDPLPVDIDLAPIRVGDASGEVGLVGLAFGPDAQPEKVEATEMSAVNLGDFDASMLPDDQTVLHRVFRYGAEGGKLNVRVAPVAPEVRVTSRQVLSLGDERVVLGINCTAEITRAGLFQLSFPLPDGMEVESLTGAALHHWSELSENGQRQIVLHLNGKTIGSQSFAISLAGLAPPEAGDWEIPRFALNEATRQTGDLVVRPTTGIRLQSVTRQNLSEMDPRQLGGEAQGALAFRLLQRDWSLTLGVEKLEPWITGQALHNVTLREGQTRGSITAILNVQNASIRSLPIWLPITDPDEIKTLRAGGKAVSDLVRTAPDSDVWEIQFKRRVVGDVEVHIDYERRGDRENDIETLLPAEFPSVRQLTYHFGVRTSGRLELETGTLPAGWQRAEWNAVPSSLRDAGGFAAAPALTLRATTPEEGAEVIARRHSLAESLKLRVANGNLTTVLSPMGDELTAVDLTMQVVQRSGLIVGLPAGGELFSIFVNGESVHSVRQGDAWQFYILPGVDERTASVRLVYLVPRDQLSRLSLVSPQLNIPLENITWRVIAPKGFELIDEEGDLERKSGEFLQPFDRASYLNKARGKRQEQAQQAVQLLEQANQMLQDGDNTRAGWALNSVANQYALDAASNEDARVQLENLQTQQAIVGLNTRRQRLLLDHAVEDSDFAENDQVRQGAAANPVLQRGAMNYRPEELVQLLQGNTNEDNLVLQQIAGRIVRQLRATEAAPQAMTITLPEEGIVYTFQRAVQVAENAPLSLALRFAPTHGIPMGRVILLLILIAALAGGIVFKFRRA
ncbi:MAG: hypothetical protein KDN20_04085 [Verrucomicrobiae bacterium]|nr:hypothetical protein [Verrucomicrobiae bacterium]